MNSARKLAVLAGTGVLTLSMAGPGYAATTVAQASANAITVSIAGHGSGSGTVTATHDGTSEHVQGQGNPPVGVLEGQGLVNVGVLAQEATAGVTDGAGHSAACAGVAGEGGSVATIGESSCLEPGQPIGLTFGNLDLSTLVVFDPDSALAPLNQATDPVIQAAVGPITQQISDNVTAQLGDGGLVASTLGAVEARCVSTEAGASGGTTIVDGKVSASFGGQSVDLLDFPVHPAPNTQVVTGLDKVADLFIEALRTDLNNTLDGQAAPLAAALDPIQEQIVDAVIGQVAPQLKPLEDNVLSATLNEQSRPTAGAIKVTAIDLQVLPAARQQIDSSLVAADIANVTCGPNGRVATPEAHSTPLPTVPQAIDSGVDHRPSGDSDSLLTALSLLLATVVGWIGYRGLRRA